MSTIKAIFYRPLAMTNFTIELILLAQSILSITIALGLQLSQQETFVTTNSRTM